MRGRETSMCVCLPYTPHWGPRPQPRHVPLPRIKSHGFAGQRSIHWATPAMWIFPKQYFNDKSTASNGKYVKCGKLKEENFTIVQLLSYKQLCVPMHFSSLFKHVTNINVILYMFYITHISVNIVHDHYPYYYQLFANITPNSWKIIHHRNNWVLQVLLMGISILLQFMDFEAENWLKSENQAWWFNNTGIAAFIPFHFFWPRVWNNTYGFPIHLSHRNTMFHNHIHSSLKPGPYGCHSNFATHYNNYTQHTAYIKCHHMAIVSESYHPYCSGSPFSNASSLSHCLFDLLPLILSNTWDNAPSSVSSPRCIPSYFTAGERFKNCGSPICLFSTWNQWYDPPC